MPIQITRNMFSTRAFHVLKNLEITTLEQVAERGKEFFLNDVPNCSKVTTNELRNVLKFHNLVFKDEFEEKVNKPTLRDKFAMAALTGLLQGTHKKYDPVLTQAAYAYADAMLRARLNG